MTPNDPEAKTQAAEKSRSERIAGILAECSDRMNAGEPVEITQVVQQHCDLDPELSIALGALRGLGRGVPPADAPRRRCRRSSTESGVGNVGSASVAWGAPLWRRKSVRRCLSSIVTLPCQES